MRNNSQDNDQWTPLGGNPAVWVGIGVVAALLLAAIVMYVAKDPLTLGILVALIIGVILAGGHVAVKVIEAFRAGPPRRRELAPPGFWNSSGLAASADETQTEHGITTIAGSSMLSLGAPEERFLRLAQKRKALTRRQIALCLGYKERRDREEDGPFHIWDAVDEQGMLGSKEVEALRESAGDLELYAVGEFSLVRKVGEGGMGTVWLATGPDDQLVALKILYPEHSRNRSYLTRFTREGEAAIKLQHENIVRGIAVGEENGYYYFAMEYVPGKSCADIVKASGAFTPVDAARIVAQIARGLGYAHGRGIVHRDIKPGNILLTRQGVAKLADLGLARQTGADMTMLTRTGTSMGTPHYMAPEQITDAKRADERSDIYSLGATWYHMVAGERPFTGRSAVEICTKHLDEDPVPPAQIREEVGEATSAIILRMLAKEPDERPQSAAEVREVVVENCLPEGEDIADVGSDTGMDTSLWEVEVREEGGVRRESLFLAELKERLRTGQVNPQSARVRPVGSDAEFQPPHQVPGLSDEAGTT